MMETLKDFQDDSKIISTVLSDKKDGEYKVEQKKNIEIGEKTEFGSIAIPKDG